MSTENAETVRRGLEHYAATGDQLWENYHPDVVVRDHQSPDQAEYHGLEGVRKWLDDWGAAWDEWHVEPEELLEAGDAVLVLIHHTARGHASGMEMDSHDGLLFTFRDGKVIGLDYITGRDRALAAAGLG